MDRSNLQEIILDMSNDHFIEFSAARDLIAKSPETAPHVMTIVRNGFPGMTEKEYRQNLAMVSLYDLAKDLGNCNFSRITHYDRTRRSWQRYNVWRK